MERIRLDLGKIPLSRRGLLAMAAGATVEALTLPFAQKASADRSTAAEQDEVIDLNAQKVHGVDVYGLKYPFKATKNFNPLEILYANLNLDFFLNEVKPAAEKKGTTPPKEIEKQRELVLDSRERYLQIVVKDSVYKQFQLESSYDGRPDFVTWVQYHIDEENRQITDIADQLPKTGLRAKLKRVIIVDDSVREEEIPNDEKYDDIDGQWLILRDVRYNGDLSSAQNRTDAAGYVDLTVREEKVVPISYSLVHEWRHRLFNWPDEYLQNVSYSQDVSYLHRLEEQKPELFISYAGGLEEVTPWTAYFFQWLEKTGIRGYSTDPKGFAATGFDGENHDPDLPANIWGKVPGKNTLAFLDQTGKPIEGMLSVYRGISQMPETGYYAGEGFYYGPKTFEKIYSEPLVGGKFTIENNAAGDFDTKTFSPIDFQLGDETHRIYPTNWYIEINQAQGGKYGLQLPVAGFNIAKLAGNEAASYTIQFGVPNTHQIPTQQILDMGMRSFPTDSSRYNYSGEYARMEVDGTPVDFVWNKDISSEKGNR